MIYKRNSLKHRMSITSRMLNDAFDFCLKEWGVSGMLKIASDPYDQFIPTTSVDRKRVIESVKRDLSKVLISDNIIVGMISDSGRFEEIYFVKEINFHADWAGIEDPVYAVLGGYEKYNASETVGAESARVEIIGEDGGRLFRFEFGGCSNKSDIVRRILGKIKLVKRNIPVSNGGGDIRLAKGNVPVPDGGRAVEVQELRAILELIRELRTDGTPVSERRRTAIIEKMETIVDGMR